MSIPLTEQNSTLLSAVERRLDERLDSLEEMLKQSIQAIKDVYEIKLNAMDQKMDAIDKKLFDKLQTDNNFYKEKRSNKFTMMLFVIGWLVTIGVSWYGPSMKEIISNPSRVSTTTQIDIDHK